MILQGANMNSGEPGHSFSPKFLFSVGGKVSNNKL